MEWLELIKSIIYGIVQGITEWLPISSTGHMILVEKWLPLNFGGTAAQSSDFFSFYMVLLHLGSILAVIVNFWSELWPFSLGKKNRIKDAGYDESQSVALLSGKVLLSRSRGRMWVNIIIACIPAAVIGLLFQDYFEALFYNPVSVSIALILVGLAFILVENKVSDKENKFSEIDQIDWRIALIIGGFQVIAAVFPGTSRSGITILGGLLIGLSRPLATKFTFYMAVPVMLGANLLKLIRFDGVINLTQALIIFVGVLTAFLVSLLVIRSLLKYIRTRDFKPFAWYRIALGVFVLSLTVFSSL